MIISKEAKIGALFFIAIAVFMVFAVAIGALPSVSRYKMTVYFDKVYGLTPGSEVWLSGTSFGTVESVEPEEVELPDSTGLPYNTGVRGKTKVLMVKAVLSLPRPVTLYDDYTISVVDKSVIAGRAVDILAGTPTRPVHEGPIIGESAGTMASIQRRMSDALTKITSEEGSKKLQSLFDKTTDALTKTTEALDEAHEALKLLTAENSNYRRMLEDPQFRENLTGAMEQIKLTSTNLAEITAKMNSQDSLFNRLATDETLYPRLESLVKNLDDFSRMLAAGKGVGRMFTDEELYRNIQDTVLEVRRIAQVANKFMAEVERDPQIVVLGRPNPNESVLAKQLRTPPTAGVPRPGEIDSRKLVPRD
jgi:ABC-type transporter Mla subunit MlaD